MCTRTGPLFCFFLTWYCWLAHRTRAQRILHRQGTIDLDEVLSANLASVQIDLFDAGQLHWRCPFIGDVTFAPPNDNYFHQETRHFSFRSRKQELSAGETGDQRINAPQANKSKNSCRGHPQPLQSLPIPFTAAFHARAVATSLAFFELTVVGGGAATTIPIYTARHVGGWWWKVDGGSV